MNKGGAESISRLVERLTGLPGVGEKTAERLAYHIVRLSNDEALELARAIETVKKSIRQCSICHLLSESDPCHICSDERRDPSTICVVESSQDAAAIEESGGYGGLYHVLGGRLAPLDGIEPEDLTIDDLLRRAADEQSEEIILATNPDMEGDVTAEFVRKALENIDVKITRIAKGLPSGSHLEYADSAIVTEALQGRREIEQSETE